MPIVLAIETSQRTGGVAVRDRAGAVHIEPLRTGTRRDDDLLPAIDRLLARLGLKPRDLEAVGVSIGPGAFTGLRIAVSTAKMLGEALDVKLIAVPSALVVAESISPPGPLLVALAAKRETFWASRLEHHEGHWGIVSAGLVAEDAHNPSGLAGIAADEHFPPEARVRSEERGIPILEPSFDPGSCLTVAERLLARGETTPPLALGPLYPREPEAVSIWERRAAKS